MTKHTPAPWHWVNSQTDEPFDFDVEWDGYGRPSLRTVAETKKSTFSLPEWILDAEPMQNGNDAANARLIAAAPELLEALKQAVDCGMVPKTSASESGASKHSRQVQVADMIRAAIAKAEGKTHVTHL
ncbi:hypothetical protein [Rhodoferax mekongensis]|uniref:Uncharacterized protein n=1 Tax=Rhodoferax mekongensis TaxID=3068341 RepID=A0ABZ0B4K2_9BURK|nr:hypothetical protein [Rhodoferax sp. TBRC 17307]WNO06004.1 hypothetical protein RAN89_06130 [Rhodoferax sp. TBRC 17307]